MAELSPAAQVMVAVTHIYQEHTGEPPARAIAAAALRAAADQVVPEEPLHDLGQRWIFERDTRQACRQKLLAIAAELESQSSLPLITYDTTTSHHPTAGADAQSRQ